MKHSLILKYCVDQTYHVCRLALATNSDPCVLLFFYTELWHFFLERHISVSIETFCLHTPIWKSPVLGGSQPLKCG